ncbi:hypothetical protein [Hymenobacter negativus]|uniref:hypothetical protein n=1 Tax=Hymenobacter negativus TaxID=2795026 RepID=UPI001AAE87AB|nr:hypothetical protein [Hymenobacter negativus]
MNSHPLPFVAGVPAVPQPTANVPCRSFTTAEIKARAKAIKKQRKQEDRRFFFSWCSCLHAIGFSY